MQATWKGVAVRIELPKVLQPFVTEQAATKIWVSMNGDDKMLDRLFTTKQAATNRSPQSFVTKQAAPKCFPSFAIDQAATKRFPWFATEQAATKSRVG